MAKITIAGKAVIVTSELKLEDIKTVEKYRPKALTIYGGEDGKDPIFVIKTGVCGGINKYGACFADATREDKLATITLVTDYDEDNIEEYVADLLGSAIINLNALEETLPEVISDISAEREKVMNNITVVS